MPSSSSASRGPEFLRTTSWAENKERDLNFTLTLYQAALRGDWESAQNFIDRHPALLTAKITPDSETALHIAVRIRKSLHFVEKLIERMTTTDLALTDDFGYTALSVAAIDGNTEAAKLLVRKNPDLPNTWSWNKRLPLHIAAQYGHKDMLLYLFSVTRDDTQPSPFADDSGVQLLIHVIAADFYDVAIDLVKRYPKLATSQLLRGDNALSMLAKKPAAFRSGAHLTFWQRFIYSRLTVELENLDDFHLDPVEEGDIENPADSFSVPVQQCLNSWIFKAYQDWHRAFWDTIATLVPYIKRVQDMKLMHRQACQVVKCLCREIKALHSSEACLIFKEPLLSGAKLGIHEIVEQILQSFPFSIWIFNENNRNIFHLAIEYRCENIFNLIYEIEGHRELLTQSLDKWGNSILHVVAHLNEPARLDILPNAALQMQRELQWYKEVEKFVQPTYKDMRRTWGWPDYLNPADIFAMHHKGLAEKGEKWIKETSNSCTIAAVLIATIVFAAAITVPGGNNGSGLPNFSKGRVFTLFAISDALSLFTSMASLLMFFSILTSRYAQADFLYDLPKKLIIQLVSLLLSLFFMMTAFSATLYLVFGNGNRWILYSVMISSSLPVILFASLQFPILTDMIRSTYGPGIFGKHHRQLLD